MQRNGQPVRHGNLEQPEAEEIHDGGSNGVARAVESLHHDHEVGVAKVAVADDAQARSAQRHYGRIVREQADHWFREKYEEDSDYSEKGDIVESGAPHGFLSALGMPGSQVLPDQRSCRVAQTPGRQEHKNDHADGKVSGEGSRTEDADYAHQADPTGVRDGKLQD